MERSVGALATDLVARPGTAAGRTLSALSLVSAVTLVVAAGTPGLPPHAALQVALVAAGCTAVAAWVWKRRVGQRVLGALLVTGDVLTTAAVVVTPDPVLAAVLWNGYLLVAVCFVLVTSPRAALLQLLVLLVASTLGRVLTGAPTTVVVAGALVAAATAIPLCVLSWAARNAAVDDVTGLPNRRGADPVVAAALAAHDRGDRAGSGGSGSLALAVVDVDGFGTVNARRGWAGGDALLGVLARELVAHLPVGAHVSRRAADSFLVLLPDLVGPPDLRPAPGEGGSGVVAVLDAALAALSHPASAGVAVHDSGEVPADLVRRAVAALTDAKLHHRGRAHLAPAGSGSLVRDLAEALRAPDEHGLGVVLQPVVDVETGAVVGVEALARWSSPQRGVVSPLEFVTAAEGAGLVGDLGAFVVRAACREVAPLRARWGGQVFLSVNASGHELVEPGYVEGLLSALAAGHLPAAALVLEVTESVLDGGSPAAVEALHALRARGVRVAVDDFGAGYSCLTRLDEVPADVLKLDATLLATAPQSPRRRTLLAAALQLARSLELTAIAEGAETPEHAALLAELGCPLVQGFGYARPASAAVLLEAGPLRPAVGGAPTGGSSGAAGAAAAAHLRA